jgi:hypothetical protein
MAEDWRRDRVIEREASAAKRAAGIKGPTNTAADRDARRLMDLIPRDTRGLTARLFGDPLPGRSALDMRQRA